MSSEGPTPRRPRTLTLHYSDTSLYRSLLLRFPGPLRALSTCAPSNTESGYAQVLVAWLNSLTPKIAELTSVTVDCSREVLLAWATDPDEFNGVAPLISHLSKKVLKLQAMAEAISFRFEKYVVETTSARKTVDDYCREKEASRAELKHRWFRLQSNVDKTRKRVNQTENAIEELKGIHKLAVYQRIRTRSRLGVVSIAHCVAGLFGAADQHVLVKAKSDALMAAKVEKRIRHDCEKLVRRRRCEMEDFTLLAARENMGRHTLVCCNADIRNLGWTSHHLRIVSCTLEVASVVWRSLAKTFEAISPSCAEQRTVEAALELWQTVSVLTRSFLESHRDSVYILLRAIQEENTTFNGPMAMEGSRTENGRSNAL